MNFPHLFRGPDGGQVPAGLVPGQVDSAAGSAVGGVASHSRVDPVTLHWLEQLGRADTWCAPQRQPELTGHLSQALLQADGFPMHRGLYVGHLRDPRHDVDVGRHGPRYLVICHDDHRTNQEVFSGCLETSPPAPQGKQTWLKSVPGGAGFFGTLANLLSLDGQWDRLMSRHEIAPADQALMLRRLMVQQMAWLAPATCERLARDLLLYQTPQPDEGHTQGPAWQPRSRSAFHPITGLVDVNGVAEAFASASSPDWRRGAAPLPPLSTSESPMSSSSSVASLGLSSPQSWTGSSVRTPSTVVLTNPDGSSSYTSSPKRSSLDSSSLSTTSMDTTSLDTTSLEGNSSPGDVGTTPPRVASARGSRPSPLAARRLFSVESPSLLGQLLGHDGPASPSSSEGSARTRASSDRHPIPAASGVAIGMAIGAEARRPAEPMSSHRTASPTGSEPMDDSASSRPAAPDQVLTAAGEGRPPASRRGDDGNGRKMMSVNDWIESRLRKLLTATPSPAPDPAPDESMPQSQP